MCSLGVSGLFAGWLFTIIAFLLALRSNESKPKFLFSAQVSFYIAATLTFWITALLIVALIMNDFSVKYVYEHTDSSTHWIYKISALWAGKEGAFLFWSFLMFTCLTICSSMLQKNDFHSRKNFIIVASIILANWLGIVVFKLNPFTPNPTPLPYGKGLNPHLQDWAMILHPPALFVGMSSITVIFALLFTNLTSRLIKQILSFWARISLAFLTCGIGLGAIWAYREISWGNYWNWDAIENLSLVLWIILLTLVHKTQPSKNVDKITVYLAGGSFSFMLLSSYLIRSGIIISLHSHTNHPATNVLLIGSIIAGITTIIIGRKYKIEIDSLISSIFVIAGITFALLLLTLTLKPIWAKMFDLKTMYPSRETFNYISAIVGLIVLILVIADNFSNKSLSNQRKKQLILTIVPLSSATMFLVWYITNIENIFILIISLLVSALIISELFTFNYNRTVYRSLAHIGLSVLIIGIIGSFGKSANKTFTLLPDNSVKINKKMTVTLKRTKTTAKENRVITQADIIVQIENKKFLLKPQYVIYGTKGIKSKPAIKRTLLYDIYLTLASLPEKDSVTIKATRIWLINFVWIGIGMIVLGTLLSAKDTFTTISKLPEPYTI